MDPNQLMLDLIAAINACDDDTACELACNYAEWVGNGGFEADDDEVYQAFRWAESTANEHMTFQVYDFDANPDDEGDEDIAGWYGRLSASGYLDCTDWSGPHESRVEALIDGYTTYDYF